jgi:hypothetical protein
MIGTLPAEALVLVTGLFPKKPPSPAHVQQALNMHARAASAIKAFLNAEKSEKVEWEKPPEQEELHKDLLAPLGDQNWAVDHLPMEIVPQYLIVINQARKYCADKWPIYDASGLLPMNYALSQDELGDIWEIIRALDGIKNFFDDLKAHCLTPQEVLAVKTCYPDWYESLDKIVFDELTTFAVKKRQLTWQQEDQIRVLRGLPDEAPITVKQNVVPPPAEPRKERAKNRLGSETAKELQTRGDSIVSHADKNG